MKKVYLLCFSLSFLVSFSAFGQQKEKNPQSNGNTDGGKVNLLLPHGYIGINTLSPSERLEVVGNVKISETLFVKDIEMEQLTTTRISVREDVRIGRNLFINGNVGIGIEQPTERLEIGGNLRVSQTIFTDALEVNQFTGNTGTFKSLSVNQNLNVNGLTGLGVASPVERLEVAGNIKATGDLMGQNLQAAQGNFNGNVSIGQELAVSGASSFAGPTSMSSLAVSAAADFSGAVAIQELKVNSTLESPAIQAGSGSFSGNFSVAGPVSLDSILLVKSSIGIGTAKVAGYSLSVDGKIRAGDDIRVYPSVEWADYVFEEDYALPGLQELEQYIRQHHHLPHIPSALSVKEEGIELGAMDAKLLQKIEELTLYTIAQEKVLIRQKELFEQKDQELQELRSELEALKVVVKKLADQN